jgi:ribbon-helix-helix protein
MYNSDVTDEKRETKKPFTFLIEPSLMEALKAVQTRDGITVSEQIRRAIQAWLKTRKAGRQRAGTR